MCPASTFASTFGLNVRAFPYGLASVIKPDVLDEGIPVCIDVDHLQLTTADGQMIRTDLRTSATVPFIRAKFPVGTVGAARVVNSEMVSTEIIVALMPECHSLAPAEYIARIVRELVLLPPCSVSRNGGDFEELIEPLRVLLPNEFDVIPETGVYLHLFTPTNMIQSILIQQPTAAPKIVITIRN